MRGAVSWADVDALEAALAAELPRFAVRYKDESTFQRIIAGAIRPFNKVYSTRYTTVMFGRVYFPSRVWRERIGPAGIYSTLRHEAVHLRDARRFPVFFQLSYLGLLPVGLTLRALWEWRAYTETLRVELELHGRIYDQTLVEIARCFTGPDYLFMCPFPRWIEGRLERLARRLEAEARNQANGSIL